MKIGAHNTHPAADVFPLLKGDEYKQLVEDIRERGLLEPIWLDHDDLVLDGRNRYRACVAAKVEPVFRRYEGDDLVAFVVSQNLRRRHLDESQRARIGIELTGLPSHRPSKSAQICALSQSEAASLMGVGRRSIQHAKTVKDRAAPELDQAVIDGKVKVSAAARAVDLPPEEQRAIADGKKKAPPPKEKRDTDTFHILIATGNLKESIRRAANRWPSESRKSVPSILRDLADELAQEYGC